MPKPERGERQESLTRLRTMLADGQALAGLNLTELGARARLGRTTTSQALSADGPVPSAATVAALARAMGLPEGELLALRRAAVGESEVELEGPGRPIGEWDPHALEVHPAGNLAPGEGGTRQVRALPGYVARAHDQVLANAVREAAGGKSRMVVLVGSSSTGKTRACWEAVQPLAAQGWRLWHPFDPTRANAALEALGQVAPCTVVWLNEAQHYLGDPQSGEHIAAVLHTLLTDVGRGPVLVLGTLWGEYADQYMRLPEPEKADPHSRVRELLAGRIVSVPDTFDEPALAAAVSLAHGGDILLADAIGRAGIHGRLAQDLAGAPELLRRYESGTPAVRALLEAAMDARRLGVGLHLPQLFLTEAAADYLSDHDHDQLTEDWAEAAYADLARHVHGKQAPLSRTGPRPERRAPGQPAPTPAPAGPMFRLADYLEQHGRFNRRLLCPPASFWQAAYDHFSNMEDMFRLGLAARRRHRLQWAWALLEKAGTPDALANAADIMHDIGDIAGMERLLHTTVGTSESNVRLILSLWEKTGNTAEAERVTIQAAENVDARYLVTLAMKREDAGAHADAERLVCRAYDAGNPKGIVALAERRWVTGDRSSAQRLISRPGLPLSAGKLVLLWREGEDYEGAEQIAVQVAEAGDGDPLADLAVQYARRGEVDRAERLLTVAAKAGSRRALVKLADLREEAGDTNSAQELLSHAISLGITGATEQLLKLHERAGNREAALSIATKAARSGNSHPLYTLAEHRMKEGEQAGAKEALAMVEEFGSSDSLIRLAQASREDGDSRGETRYLRQAADRGSTRALYLLAESLQKSGNHEEAISFLLKAESHGSTGYYVSLPQWFEQDGMLAAAEKATEEAVDAGAWDRVRTIARIRRRAGDIRGSRRILELLEESGDDYAAHEIVQLHQRSGNLDEAKRIALRSGSPSLIRTVASRLSHSGRLQEAIQILTPLATAGDDLTLSEYAILMEHAGDTVGAETSLQSIKSGNTSEFFKLARIRRAAGNSRGAKRAASMACNAEFNATNSDKTVDAFSFFPFGLDANGDETPPWKSE
ncbi:hypothetical protein [Streptomyces sp. NPDC059979]|uniref:hypothetical protein n=1 Tax=Streptomyces sp. NPDC059979 TaxID=3347021 RepID=UPI0036959BE5